ncbi:hypothetical protein PanWU01x14_048250 [Parasponia andersonii]|uniref:Uncharacterized protein n=1 Tax=Parasponia andersonii TaxID=3476 RepID=A0A2P5DNB5_PARAD|nr:hypothetical protein PanWU01x14_048250 [Parasponia andersonii]
MRNRDLLKLGAACRRIQQGGAVDIWNDSWIPSLGGFQPRPKQLGLETQLVHLEALISPSGSWDSSMLFQLFLSFCGGRIRLSEPGEQLEGWF